MKRRKWYVTFANGLNLRETRRTKETFVDGWVRTGDEVKFTKSGDVFVVDRLKVVHIHLIAFFRSANA